MGKSELGLPGITPRKLYDQWGTESLVNVYVIIDGPYKKGVYKGIKRILKKVQRRVYRGLFTLEETGGIDFVGEESSRMWVIRDRGIVMKIGNETK